MDERMHSGRWKTLLIIATVTVLVIALPYMLLGAQETSDQTAYRVGPEDTVGVTVARHPDLSGDYTVPSDGAINVPGAGRVTVAGKTLAEISSDIASRLADRLRSPEVTVTLKSARMQRVYVLGAVQKSGLYDLKPGWRITEALAAAGGLASGVEAVDCSATILRAATGTRKTARLSDVLKGLPDANTVIETADVLTIETDETVPVYITGRVKNPGLYKLRKDSAGVVEALTLAGGALDDAALSKITVAHIDGSNETVNLALPILEGKPAPEVALRPADLITVPEETSRIAVLGSVNQPGFYTVREHQRLTLTDALGLAKGTEAKYSRTKEIAVIRTENGKQQRIVVDLEKFLKSGDATQNPAIKPGDVIYVPRSGKVNWETIVGSIPLINVLFMKN